MTAKVYLSNDKYKGGVFNMKLRYLYLKSTIILLTLY